MAETNDETGDQALGSDPEKLHLKNQVKVEGGVMAAECGSLLTAFFAAKR